MLYLIIGIILLVIILIIIYNRLVMLNIRCKNGWASIDNQLKRRNDLIPNLVEVTKGYAKHESETLEKIVKARSISSNNIDEIATNSKAISNGVNNLLAIAEQYPDLKANEVFMNLQIELTGTEDKIAYARQFYNDSVQLYNTAIEQFPSNLLAKLFKFEQRQYFAVSDSEKQNVEVKL